MLTELVSAFSLQQSYSGGVKGRPSECSCRSIMLRQDELAFMKAISTLQVSPALLKEMRLAMARRKKPAVPAGERSTTSGSGTRASQQLAGKRKANELASSGDSMESANRPPAPGAGAMPLSATSTATGEQAAAGNRQAGPSGGRAMYAAVLVRPAAPSQPSGPLKPRAKDSDPSEPGVSMETTNRRMSSDMSGHLSGRPDATTSNAQEANACVPAGESPNKTPIFISGVSDTRSFLAWLRASCPGGLMSQLKGENFMVVPSTIYGFRAAVRALRSLDGKDGVSFHTFTLPEDRCARLLVMNLGTGLPYTVIRKELEYLNTDLNSRVQRVTQPRSGRRDADTPRTVLPPHTSLYEWREGLSCQKCNRSPNSAVCECRWSRAWLQKGRCNACAVSASAIGSVTADTHPGASHVGALTSPVVTIPCGNSLSAVAEGETTQRTRVAV